MNEEELRAMILTEVAKAHNLNALEVREIVRTAVQETLVTMGMDAGHPLKLQQDMAFLRDLRSANESLRRRGMLVALGIVVTGLTGALWLGIKAALSS
jgi:hypothetical protein